MNDEILNQEIEFVKDSGGQGNGTWFLNQFLYWEAVLKSSVINLGIWQRKVNKFLNFLLWLLVFSGIFSFLIYLYLNWSIISKLPSDLLFFWTYPDPFLLYFFISLWFVLYLIYKNSIKRASQKKIKYSKRKNKTQTTKKTQRLNVAKTLSNEAERTLEEAFLLAKRLNRKQVNTLHFFRVALKSREVQNLFIRLNVDIEKLIKMLDKQLVHSSRLIDISDARVDQKLKEALIESYIVSHHLKQDNVKVLNILFTCIKYSEILQEILLELEIDEVKILNTILWFNVDQRFMERYRELRRLSFFKPSSNMNRSYTAIATPTLDHFSYDLTLEAKFGNLDLCIGRDQEIKEIFEAMIGGHHGVLLVGENGAGKTAIIHGIAQLMTTEEVPDFLRDKRLVEIDVPRLVSGADPAVAQERLLRSINEAQRSGNIILYLDNVENIIGISAGSQESLDLSEVLAEAVSRGTIFCLATANTENYVQYIERRAIGSSFMTTNIKEPSENNAIQILQSKVRFLETRYKVYIVYGALEQAVNLSIKYLKDKALPLKAINLLTKAVLISLKIQQQDPNKLFCSGEDVALAIEEMTGIPVSRVGEEEREKLLNLEKEIKRRLIGQDEAVKAVSASLRRARVAIKDKNRPIASFLFLGPTGVGKTELAKTVSEIYFNSEDYMIRLDMSEYQHADSIKKMIGDTDGSLGYLTEMVRKKPFALILLDEIEKADANILNLLLQLLDDGRLTDAQGRTINFSEAIIIATSNIGAKYIQDEIKKETSLNEIKQTLIDHHLREKMRPELINRFDGIIVFHPLSDQDIFEITILMLQKMKKSLLEKGITLKADQGGVRILAREGYDPKFGARPLRRLLQERIEDTLANKILSQDLERRDTVIINSKAEVIVQKGKKL